MLEVDFVRPIIHYGLRFNTILFSLYETESRLLRCIPKFLTFLFRGIGESFHSTDRNFCKSNLHRFQFSYFHCPIFESFFSLDDKIVVPSVKVSSIVSRVSCWQIKCIQQHIPQFRCLQDHRSQLCEKNVY